jgi:hypothetical protein
VLSRKLRGAGFQWCTPVILATWEAEIGRIMIWGQSGQNIQETPSQLRAVVVPVIPKTVESVSRSVTIEASLGKKRDPISKDNPSKTGWRCGSSSKMPA